MKSCFSTLVLVCSNLVAAPAAPQKSSAPPQQPARSSETIRGQTRLIAIDVVVTDSHGAPVRGLTKEDFQIFEEHNREQQVAQFRFVDRPANAPATAKAPASAALFSNAWSSDPRVAPTVLLMDALNTEMANQMQVRQKMLLLLKALPPTTPVAVFTLGHALHIVQTFSTDPKALRAAIDNTLRSVSIEQNPQDDADSPSNRALDQNGGEENQATRALEDFEAMTYQAQMAIRVDETAEAMIQISKYLRGYAGRKNLIWFSEAFPDWIAPSADFGADPFSGSASYSDKIRAAAEALTDARIAVYPVDAPGLTVDPLYSVAQNPHINQQNIGGGLGAQLSRQNGQHVDRLATMDNIAQATGGRTCKNTNDLSGCVQSALNDGATYYELGYYPEGIAWDGRFHKIVIKSTQHGVKLSYRRGYYATDLKAVPGGQKPEDLLKQACMNPLPSTSIMLTVLPIAPQSAAEAAKQPAQNRYLLTVSSAALTFESAEGTRQLNLHMAICEFNPKEDSFQFFPRDLSRSVPENVYEVWKERGIQNILDYAAKPGDQRLRFAVLDVPSGEIGSVDAPAHPHEFASATGSPLPLTAQAAATPGPETRTIQIVTKIAFRTQTAASWLDWTGKALSYHGDIGIEQGAPAFFKNQYGAKFHCEAGKLVANDAGSNEQPDFLLTFRNLAGPSAQVELGGDRPEYSGDLQVDLSAKGFFDYLWKLVHCQSP